MTGCIAGTNMGSEIGAAMQVDTPEDAPRDIRVMYRERTVVVGTAGHLSRRRRRRRGRGYR